MTADEATIRHVEESVPELATSAGRRAFWATLAAGHAVLESEAGVLYEVFPDGARREVERIEPPVPVKPGTTRRLK